MGQSKGRDRSESRVTEVEMRKAAIDSLRTFQVTTGEGVVESVFAHRVAVNTGALLFMVDTIEGTFVRHIYRDYRKCSELVQVDHNASGTRN